MAKNKGSQLRTSANDLRPLERTIRNFIMKSGADAFSKESLDWYRDYVTQNFKARSFKNAMATGDHTIKPRPGFLYTYAYDAKHKDTLPYWDMFPLVLCVDVYEDGWLGINFHYLPPKIRAAVFLEILETQNKPGYDEKTKFKITWAKLKAMTNSRYIRHGVKRYLTSQLRTPMAKIHPRYWEIVMFMPYAQFQKATQKEVWRDIK